MPPLAQSKQKLPDAAPRLALRPSHGTSLALPQGRWTAAWLAQSDVWEALQTQVTQVAPQMEPAWDLRQIQRLDHTGAQLLWDAWQHQWPLKLQALPFQRAMLERVAQYSVATPPARPTDYWQEFLGLGRKVMRALDHFRDLARLIGQLVLDTWQLVRAPRQGPWRDVSGHIYHVGTTALPITALVGFLIGVVLAYLLSRQLRQFGADAFIVNILGLALSRELGPV